MALQINFEREDFWKASEGVWRFESVHSFASVGNLYQKMHFAGSNLSTDPKCPKCIYKILKNFRVEKSGEISRNLRFSRFFVPASKSDTHHGWGSWTRTNEMQESKSCALTDLAIPHYEFFWKKPWKCSLSRLSVSALSYRPSSSPSKYCRHCKA